jgi:magnesium-transporting ATPase (P-type)
VSVLAEKVGTESVAGQLAVGARAFRRVSTPLQRQINLILQVMLLLAIPPLRAFFELTALDARSYLLIGLAALAWLVVLRWVWRARLLERFLQLDWREG